LTSSFWIVLFYTIFLNDNIFDCIFPGNTNFYFWVSSKKLSDSFSSSLFMVKPCLFTYNPIILAGAFSWLNKQKLCKITRKCVKLRKTALQ